MNGRMSQWYVRVLGNIVLASRRNALFCVDTPAVILAGEFLVSLGFRQPLSEASSFFMASK